MDATSQPEATASAPEQTQTDGGADELPVEPESPPVDSNTVASDSSPEPVGPVPPAPPSHYIAEGGRLSIDAGLLRDGEVIAVGLGLADEARDTAPMAVRVVSVDGRRIETHAAPIPGSGTGLRLELDPEWLTSGRYMIEVHTAEKSHFPLRRYVLEVP